MNNEDLRAQIYHGEIIHLPADSVSLCLVEHIIDLVREHFGDNYRRAQFSLSAEDFARKLRAVKDLVYQDKRTYQLGMALLKHNQFNLAETLFDPPRVRAVQHHAHFNPAAQAAFRSHRDTWYANPQAQINWWIPLHDVSEGETFCFFPEYFASPIPNDSESFYYDEWIRTVGFGNSSSGAGNLYPHPNVEPEDQPALGFKAAKGDVILFSAAHLHRTNPNDSGLTRFSIDFRTVNKADHDQGRGAPNVDNNSKGSSLPDYISCEQTNVA